MKKKIKWLFLILFLLIFAFIASHLVKMNVIDDAIYNFIYFENDIITMFFKIITNFVCVPFLLFISIIISIILCKKKQSKTATYMIINLIVIVLLNVLLKNIFSRTRPLELMLIDETGFSFPSGHAMVSMGFYGFIIYLIYNSKVNFKKIFISLLSLLILLIGISRVYLGVHYASDIIAGFSISIIYLIIFTSIISREYDMKKSPLYKSFMYAIKGILTCLKNERNLRIHFGTMFLVIIIGLFLKISMFEWFTCLILFALVISLELVNTAIEATVDICSPEINPKAALAKDAAAGAVLISVIIAVIAGIIIFLPKLISLF